MTTLTGSAYVRAVVGLLIARGSSLNLTEADLDEEQSNIPAADGEWLRWAEDYGWHLCDDQGRREAPLCDAYTPIDEAARIIDRYIV